MTTETIQRAGCTARVLAGDGYYHVGETLCQLEDTAERVASQWCADAIRARGQE